MGTLLIGGNQDPASGATSAHFAGEIDEVAVYRHRLSEDTVANHFSVGAERATKEDGYAGIVDAAPGLRAWWRLNEGFGWMCEDSAGASHARKLGSWTGASPLIGGSPGRAIAFSGGYLDCASNSAIQLTERATLEAWVGIHQLPASGVSHIIYKSAAYSLWITPAGAVGLNFSLSD
jgi:hypothetical protein